MKSVNMLKFRIYILHIIRFNKKRGDKMFHKFKNQDERKNFGGTAFVEFAYCKNKSKFKTNIIQPPFLFITLITQ